MRRDSAHHDHDHALLAFPFRVKCNLSIKRYKEGLGVPGTMALVFAFFNFMFYKIMSTAMFDDPMTIWGSALTAITVTLIMAFAGPVGMLFSYEEAETGDKLRIGKLLLVFIGACAISCVVAYLIALGFSERLYQDISNWRRYRELWEQDLFWFCVMISIPVVVHLGTFYWRLRSVD